MLKSRQMQLTTCGQDTDLPRQRDYRLTLGLIHVLGIVFQCQSVYFWGKLCINFVLNICLICHHRWGDVILSFPPTCCDWSHLSTLKFVLRFWSGWVMLPWTTPFSQMSSKSSWQREKNGKRSFFWCVLSVSSCMWTLSVDRFVRSRVVRQHGWSWTFRIACVTLHDCEVAPVTSQRLVCEIFFFAVCSTIFHFEFQPQTFSIGFYEKNLSDQRLKFWSAVLLKCQLQTTLFR